MIGIAWFQAEKRLNALGKIPTNVEKMEEQLREQRDLDEEVDQKAEDVDRALAVSDAIFTTYMP